MELALKFNGLAEGDEVIFPTLTFYILPQIVQCLGLKPAFVNCREDFTIDIEELREKITPRTKAIIATHIFGRACQIDVIKEIADQKGIFLIEDCAHVTGVAFNGKLLGTFGDTAFFSFQNRKPVNAFGGGVLITDNEALYNFAKEHVATEKPSCISLGLKLGLNVFEHFLMNKYFCLLTSVLLRNKFYRKKILSIYQLVHHKNVDVRKAFSKFQARVALEQLLHLDERNSRNVKRADLYSENLEAIPGLTTPRFRAHNYYSYVALLDVEERAELLYQEIFRYGIDVGTGEDILRNCGRMYDPENNYAATDELLARMIELPMYHQLKEKTVMRISQTVRDILQ